MGSPTLELCLLGPLEVVADGRAMELGGPRQRALLALLLREPGRPMSSGRLAEELWHGDPPAGAETTLRSYVSRLRKALGRDAVVSRAGGYVLDVDQEQVDAFRFERLLSQGREAMGRGAAGLASERLHAALALWRGRALADVFDSGCLAGEARRLEELRLVCVEERLEADLMLGRHAELVPELRLLVEHEPLRERLWCQLVLALYRSGQQAEALAAYREARQLLDSELGLEPGEELKELERAILRQQIAAPAPPEVRHNLPAAVTTFVGRETEVAELTQLLRGHRLITVTGMGGAGKTRLVLETAWGQLDSWSGGVWLVDLTALSHPDLVQGAVAAALGVAEAQGDRLLEALLGHLRPLELLLVLDNCEHVAAACAGLAVSLLRACPNVRLVATSRVSLAVHGELEYALDPLAAPEVGGGAEELERSPAVRLFLERAAAVRRGVADGAGALPTSARICRELDGLPLAIELAAARAGALSLEEIAARLDDRFRFLRAWKRVADPRHRTLQTMMDWSYELLSPEEQELLRRMSLFAGGAALDAVIDVAVRGGEEAVELLGRLVDASLVRAEAGEPMRYRLLETVRQYAAAKLDEDPDADDARRRHAEHYLRVAEAANLSIESLGRGPQRHEPVLLEQHNLRAAIDWAAASDVALALRLMVALENFWITQAVAEGRRRFEDLLGRADGVDLVLRGHATRDYAGCLDVLEDVRRARAAYARSGELFRRAGDEVGVANAIFRLGVVASVHENEHARARELFEESLAEFRRLGDEVGELQALGSLGALELRHGDVELGRGLMETSIAMAHELGWVWWESRHAAGLAVSANGAGRLEEAERWGREFLSLARTTRSRQDVIYALAILARAAAARGDEQRALALWSSVEALEDGPGRFGRFDRREYEACMPVCPRPAPLPLEQAVELALSN
ncbi:MAG TPA: BTAD domain-containing putative transcriptional regulator [Gaiellaceae bacterium]